MNEFNRVVVILICRLFITAAVVVVALAWTSSTSSIDALQDGVEWLSENNQDTEKWVLTAIAAVLGVLALIVLILQPNRPSDDEVRVSDLQGGDAVLSTAATGERVEQAVMQVANVSDVRASVKSWRGDVLLGMDLQVDSEADLVAVTDEACETAKSVLTDRLHVRLAAPPAVRVKYGLARPRAAQRARVAPPSAHASRRGPQPFLTWRPSSPHEGRLNQGQENRPARRIDPATTPRLPEPPRTDRLTQRRKRPRQTRLDLKPAELKTARASLSPDKKPAPPERRAAAGRHVASRGPLLSS